jgi:hypothetical protein
MNKNTRVVVVLIVAVAVVAVAYLALVGYRTQVADIGAAEDPTGQDREPIAYAAVSMHCTVKNVIDGFSGTVVNDVTVFDWVSSESARLYDTQAWDVLGFFEDDVTVWVETTVSGPGNYFVKWTSEKIEDSIPELYLGSGDEHEYDFGPYTAKFYDSGTYTLTTSLMVEWSEGWDAPQKVAQDSDKFIVGG